MLLVARAKLLFFSLHLSLKTQKFSCASDTWAYGIFLFELFSAGSYPMDDMEDSEVIAFLSSYR